jgi:hypothetical protein
VSETVQPEETQGVSRGFWTNWLNIGRVKSTDIEKRDSAPATPAESIHTTPTHESSKELYDEESEDPFDVEFYESPVIPLSLEEDPRRQDTSREDDAEADNYFKRYLTASATDESWSCVPEIRLLCDRALGSGINNYVV